MSPRPPRPPPTPPPSPPTAQPSPAPGSLGAACAGCARRGAAPPAARGLPPGVFAPRLRPGRHAGRRVAGKAVDRRALPEGLGQRSGVLARDRPPVEPPEPLLQL